ncbi:hypothetical protein GCM10011316_31390 [Roseibium aquae]|uniref:AMP-binding enzyme n=1 Tax=Roseibium aquae TaxID=1323746 RepID=A0A916TLT1_9HYPH|nr:hypothetical protein [Roseibium aquae]GGB57015.1 hypothetical protein GCM10011316_31390 [Roseibium aquae]
MDTAYPLPCELLKKGAAETPGKVDLRPPANHAVQKTTWLQVHDEVVRLTFAFLSMWLKKGDVAAILGKETAERFIADFALGAVGMISSRISKIAPLLSHEMPSHLVVADEPWTIENEFLTPTMKLKRSLLEQQYASLTSKPASASIMMEREAAFS